MKQTTLCYIQRGDEYLMLHRVRKQNDGNHDKWIGVGGKLENGESPEECVLREAREETGLTLTNYRYRGVITFLSGDWGETMHLFTATGFTGELTDCDEGVLEWISRDRLMALPMWQGDRIFLNRIANDNSPFFSLKLEYDGEVLARATLDGVRLRVN
ncbi:MAG: 8-oxo-dGTP diphosphatase [Clostridia bacterium]|nr:8-oxo-dGTP diphosphatase [Clostridia bacterium]